MRRPSGVMHLGLCMGFPCWCVLQHKMQLQNFEGRYVVGGICELSFWHILRVWLCKTRHWRTRWLVSRLVEPFNILWSALHPVVCLYEIFQISSLWMMGIRVRTAISLLSALGSLAAVTRANHAAQARSQCLYNSEHQLALQLPYNRSEIVLWKMKLRIRQQEARS